jgi:hypothetical protein
VVAAYVKEGRGVGVRRVVAAAVVGVGLATNTPNAAVDEAVADEEGILAKEEGEGVGGTGADGVDAGCGGGGGGGGRGVRHVVGLDLLPLSLGSDNHGVGMSRYCDKEGWYLHSSTLLAQ